MKVSLNCNKNPSNDEGKTLSDAGLIHNVCSVRREVPEFRPITLASYEKSYESWTLLRRLC